MQNEASHVIPQGSPARLALEHIGLTESQVRKIGEAAVAARSEYLEGVDPANAPGIKAYQAGIRQLRLEMLPAGWDIGRFNNIEVVVNHKLGLMLGFQNVHQACGAADPQSISDRGPGTRDLVARPYNADLFNPKAATQAQRKISGAQPVVWFVCVSASTQKLQVEVSRPKPFEGVHFEGFFERIHVLDESINEPSSEAHNEADELDGLEVEISRKQNGNP
ncbi:hypothetical protein [Pseudomonas nitroreducens]|uniref:hypothetical protein n=1 Tax=Pseudomonas nitroreducens TaxID=46680 RepID=UPI001FB5EB09|nr:hypothetical protein [Pseudomonas nitroreducens]MCJ1879654.1 hypothetical protein [Pseudomonas nitroreducens]MCJ1896815.1 hypothetical protein [Pseudomonas nitroreducens]